MTRNPTQDQLATMIAAFNAIDADLAAQEKPMTTPTLTQVTADQMREGERYRVVFEGEAHGYGTLAVKTLPGGNIVIVIADHALTIHHIETPKPIAVGDRVSVRGVMGMWLVVAIHDDHAWLTLSQMNDIVALKNLTRIDQ